MFVNGIEKIARVSSRIRGARSHSIESELGSAHFLTVRGNAASGTIVLIHGISAASYEFVPLAECLKPYCRQIIMPDLPGHGLSESPIDGMSVEAIGEFFTSTLSQELKEPAIVVGNSLGGSAAIRFASTNPDLVKGLILISPGGAQMSPEEFKTFISQFKITSYPQTVAFLKRIYAEFPWYAVLFTPLIIDRFNRNTLKDFIQRVSPKDLISAEEVSSLKPRTMMIWGKKDGLQSESQFEFFKTQLPAGTKIVRPEDFGHCPHIESPRELSVHLAEFIQELNNN